MFAVRKEISLNLSKIRKNYLDKRALLEYNIQADMALKASWIEPDDIGGRENNV